MKQKRKEPPEGVTEKKAADTAGSPADISEAIMAGMTDEIETGAAAVNYVYIVRCSDGSYYTGWTNNLPRRLAAHNAGRGGKYTRARRPVELVYSEQYAAKAEAMQREWQLKRLTHAQKQRLIESAPLSGDGEKPGE